MRRIPFTLAIVYCFFLLSGRVHGIGEKTITLGSGFSWELVEKRQGVTEAALIRPGPVLVLAGNGRGEAAPDLYLSFDEGRPGNFADAQGNYDVSVSPALAQAAAPWSRHGAGAALFTGEEPLTLRPGKTALFAPGSHVRDFSIEFWLYPLNLENGEQIVSLYASMPDSRGGHIQQRVQCAASKNRLNWTFENFFFSPGGQDRKALSFSGSRLIPGTWSHHLIRFDADLGLLEYLVDGRLEAVDYVTSSGREGGEAYTPVIGEDCRLVLGGRYSGMMDEFRVYREYREETTLAKYSGGRVETRTLDLGYSNSRLLRLDAFGGRTSGIAAGIATGITAAIADKVQNEYAGNSALRFPDHSQVNFFIRTGNHPYRWNDVPWVPVSAGTDLSDFRGRYVQIAADFYPGADGETSPYLSELRVVYDAGDPPAPPVQVTALAKDGAVELSWKASHSGNVGGYLVYFGTARGEYFGDDAIMGGGRVSSPVNAGNRTSVRIEGLNNGTLYYFRVAAYNPPEPGSQGPVFEPGDFSREAAARPLRMAE